MPSSNGSSVEGTSAGRHSVLDQSREHNKLSVTKETSSIFVTAEKGMFGVMNALATEKTGAGAKLVTFAVVLEYVLFLGFMFEPQFDYRSGSDLQEGVYLVLEKVQLQQYVIDQGYGVYRGVSIFLACILIATVLICAYAGFQSSQNKQANSTLLRFARLALGYPVTAIYLCTFQLLFAAVDCSRVDGGSSPIVVNAFPDRECWSSGHIAIFCLNGFMTILLAGMGFAVVLMRFQISPSSPYVLAGISPDISLRLFVYKTLMVIVVKALRPWKWLQVLCMLVLCCLMAMYTIKKKPFYRIWMSKMQGGMFLCLSWNAFILCLVTWSNDINGEAATVACFVCMPLTLLAGVVIGEWQYRRVSGAALVIETETGLACREDIVWADPEQVELATRFSRRKRDDQAALELADTVYQAGLREFSSSCFLHLAYANWLTAFNYKVASAQTYWDRAQQLQPSFMQRYFLFNHDRERKLLIKKAHGEGESMDLASYVEFQTAYQDVLQYHESALKAYRAVWRLFASDRSTVSRLCATLERIEAAENSAQQVFRLIFERFPKTARLLRSYGRFLDEVVNEPRTAARFFSEAERLDIAARDARDLAGEEEDGEFVTNIASKVDDKVDAVIVINDLGIMTNVNRIAAKIFGYKKQELNGRNVKVLMPPPFNTQHDAYLRNYNRSGKGKILGKLQNFEGRHKNGYVIPIILAVNRIDSAQGVSFMGVIKPRVDPTAVITISKSGTILTVSETFEEMFGYRAQDLQNKNVTTIMPRRFAEPHGGYLKKINEDLDAKKRTVKNIQGRQLFAKHKNGSEFAISLDLQVMGEGAKRTFTGRIRNVGDATATVAIKADGTMTAASQQIVDLFGYANIAELVGQNVKMLMHPDVAVVHDDYIARRVAGQGLVGTEGRVVEAMHADGSSVLIFLSLHDLEDQEDGSAIGGRLNRVSEAELSQDPGTARVIINTQGIMVEINEALCDISGYSRHDLMLQNISMLMPSEIADKHDGYLRRYFAGDQQSSSVVGVVGQEFALLRQDGGMITTSVAVSKTTYEGEPALLGYLTPMNSKGISFETDGIVEIDSGGKILAANEAVHELFGYEVGDLVDKKINILMPQPYNRQHDTYLRNYEKTGRRRIMGVWQNLEGVQKDGTSVPVALKVDRVSRGKSHVYVGHLKVREEEHGKIVVDPATKEVLSISETALKMFGYRAGGEVVGRNVKMLMPERFAVTHDSLLDAYVKRLRRSKGKTVLKKTEGRRLTGLRSDGTEFHMALTLDPSTSGGQKVVSAQVTDISNAYGMVGINERGIIVSASDVIAMMWGFSNPGELVGKRVNVLMPERTSEVHDSYIQNYMQTGVRKVTDDGRLVEAKHSDGSTFLIHLGVSEMAKSTASSASGATASSAGSGRRYTDRQFSGRVEFGSIGVAKNDAFTCHIRIDEEGTVSQCSDHIIDILGYTPGELMGKNIKMITPEKIAVNHDEYLRRFKATGRSSIIGGPGRQLMALRKDGCEVCITLYLEQGTDFNGNNCYDGYLVPMNSIPIIDPDVDGLVVIDAVGTIIEVNDALARMFGYTIGELTDQNIKLLMGSPYREQHDAYLRNYAKNGKATILGTARNLEGVHKMGTKFPIELSVTRFQLNDAVHFRGLVKPRVDGAVWVKIDENGIIQETSSDFCKQFLYDEDEIEGENVKMIMPEKYAEHHDGYLANFRECVQRGERGLLNTKGRQLLAKKKNGVEFFIALTLERTRDGYIRGFIDIIGDCLGSFSLDKSGNIFSVNPDMLSITGHASQEDLTGSHLSCVIPLPPPRDQETDVDQFLSLPNVGTGACVEVLHGDGSRFLGKVTLRAVRDSDDESSHGGTRSITSVEESSQIMGRITHASITDLLEDPRCGSIHINVKGIILSVTPALCMMLGYQEDELVGENVKIITPPEVAVHHDGYLNRWRRTGKSAILAGPGRQLTARKKNGKIIDVILFAEQSALDGRTTINGVLWPMGVDVHEYILSTQVDASAHTDDRENAGTDAGAGAGLLAPLKSALKQEVMRGQEKPSPLNNPTKQRNVRIQLPQPSPTGAELMTKPPSGNFETEDGEGSDAENYSPVHAPTELDDFPEISGGHQASEVPDLEPIPDIENVRVNDPFPAQLVKRRGVNVDLVEQASLEASFGVKQTPSYAPPIQQPRAMSQSTYDGGAGVGLGGPLNTTGDTTIVADTSDNLGLGFPSSGGVLSASALDDMPLGEEASSTASSEGNGGKPRKKSAPPLVVRSGWERETTSRSLLKTLRASTQYHAATMLAAFRTRMSLLFLTLTFVLAFAVSRFVNEQAQDCVSAVVVSSDLCRLSQALPLHARQVWVDADTPQQTQEANALHDDARLFFNHIETINFGVGVCHTGGAIKDFMLERSRVVRDPVVGGNATYSLWELGSHFVRHALQIPSEQTPRATIGSLQSWLFVMENAPNVLVPLCEELTDLETRKADMSFRSIVAAFASCAVVQVVTLAIVTLGVFRRLDTRMINMRAVLFGCFLVLPRPVMYQFARQRIVVGEESDSDSDGGKSDEYDLHLPPITSEETDRNQQEPTTTASRLWNKVRSATSNGALKKKKEKIDVAFVISNETERLGLDDGRLTKFLWRFRLPISVWIVLIVCSCSVGVSTASNRIDPMHGANAAAKTLLMATRMRFFALEMVSQANKPPVSASNEAVAVAKSQLFDATDRFSQLYQALLYGDSELDVPGSLDRNYAFKRILFDSGQCLRKREIALCARENDPYYSWTQRGLSLLMLQFIEDSRQLMITPVSQLNSTLPAWQRINEFGKFDLRDGLEQVVDIFAEEIDTLWSVDTGLQCTFLVLTVIGMSVASSRIVEPFFNKISVQTKRIASALSFMPKDVNVNNVVIETIIALDPNNDHLQSGLTAE